MTEAEAAELAREVVRELFTHADGWKAVRLVLEKEGFEIQGPGWPERAAMMRVTRLLLKHSKKMGMGRRR